MPTALETLIKILKLEREQGGQDTAVVGGISAFAAGWEADARREARKPAHHILLDEIVDNLASYASIESGDARIARVNYLLDRITNRAPAPKQYRDRLAQWSAKMGDKSQSGRRGSRGRGERQSDRRQAKPSRGRKYGGLPGKPAFGDEDSTWEQDYRAAPAVSELDLKPLPALARPPRMPRTQLDLKDSLALYDRLDAPTTDVKGIGEKLAQALEQLELRTVGDLLYNLPRDYHDYTRFTCIRDLAPDATAHVIATVKRSHAIVGAQGREDLLAQVSDGSGDLSLRFFGQGYLARRLRRGVQVELHGKVAIFRGQLQMANPTWDELDLENLRNRGLTPVYRLTQGLRERSFRNTMKALTADWAGLLPDPLPTSVLERAELADLGWAIRQAHFPAGPDHLRHAQRRLRFDDLLLLQLAVLGNRRDWRSLPGTPLPVADESLDAFIERAFDFDFTDAQRNAIREIRRDMAESTPMTRLLQGDVGSGKTAVAFVALALALFNGGQAALMAPTGILAEQHYHKLCAALEDFPGDQQPVIALLTGGLSQTERESIYRGLADGSIDVVVGTHALIQEGVEFQHLAAAVIDEQQRFGVEQRSRLRGKGRNPHLLIMTATPIPRTHAQTIYADLDLTLIDEMPPGRQPVITKIIDPIARERLHGFVEAQLEAGNQAFFAHPLVDESDVSDTPAAVEAYERLQGVFFRHRVCLLHGRMSQSEKDELMDAFRRGDYAVMVTTSVAEVGVDVPNATVMAVDGANRFGLAQLHQFRGRVGRGSMQSWCFLMPDNNENVDVGRILDALDGVTPDEELSIAERRLAAMARTNDGFELAELDWQLRGGGDLLGWRQSGSSLNEALNIASPELVALAQREARTLYEEDPALDLPQHQLLKARIAAKYPAVRAIS